MSNLSQVMKQAFIRKTNIAARKVKRFTGHTARWRRLVLSRDGFQCLLCGSSTSLQAHHIERWYDAPLKRLKVSNGATLCKKCHTEHHDSTGHEFPAEVTRRLIAIISGRVLAPVGKSGAKKLYKKPI